MRRVLRAIALVAVMASTTQAQSAAPVDPAVRSLRSADSSWNEASISRNVDRMMAFYLPNATSDLGGVTPARGAPAIRQMWVGAYKDSTYRLSWTLSRTELVSGTDLGYTIGAWRLSRAAGERTGTYFAVWQKQADGRWIVLLDTAR